MNSGAIAPVCTLISPRQGHRTYCVLGVPRGGTSMIAGLLIQLGIPMGDRLVAGNLEDEAFLGHKGIRRIFTKSSEKKAKCEYLSEVREIIKKRNSTHNTWGWKDPLASYYVSDINDNLRNPHYIIVTRDVGAITTRENQFVDNHEGSLSLDHLQNAIQEYAEISNFVKQQRPPALLVSYERTLRHPSAAVVAIARFLGMEEQALDSETLMVLSDYIRPERNTADIDVNQDSKPMGSFDVPIGADNWATHVSGYVGEEDGDLYITDLEATYIQAARLAQAGNLEKSSVLAAAILDQIAETNGDLNAGAENLERAVTREPKRATELPQMAIGCLNILAVANLNRGYASTACDLFSAAFAVAKIQVDSLGQGAPISFDLLWWLALHAAISGQRCGRVLVVQRFYCLLKDAAAKGTQGVGASSDKAQEMLSRAEAELDIQAMGYLK